MAKLNNSNAYGFCKNVVSNVMIKTMQQLHPVMKCSPVVSKSEFKPVEVKLGKLGKVSCLAGNVNDGILPLSMHHMMNCQKLGFIYNGVIYIITRETLQANWNEIMVKNPYKYIDGLGMKSSMTPADINKLVELSEFSYNIPENLNAYYMKKQKEYFNKEF